MGATSRVRAGRDANTSGVTDHPRASVQTRPEPVASRVEEALADGGDEAFGSSIHTHLVPEGAEAASGVPRGASKSASERGDGVAAGEVVEDDAVPFRQISGCCRFEAGRQGSSEVTRDGEVAGGLVPACPPEATSTRSSSSPRLRPARSHPQHSADRENVPKKPAMNSTLPDTYTSERASEGALSRNGRTEQGVPETDRCNSGALEHPRRRYMWPADTGEGCSYRDS